MLFNDFSSLLKPRSTHTKTRTIMTVDELIEVLTKRFPTNIAAECTTVIIDNQAIEMLYDLAVNTTGRQVSFRAAYVLDFIYFNHNEKLFWNFKNNLLRAL